MADSYGYREGKQLPVVFKVDASSSAISVGDMLAFGTAGYVQQAAAGDKIIGFAMQDRAAGSADGDVTILVDVSQETIYEFPAGTGTLTIAMTGKTCDISGARGLDVTASADDCIIIRRVNTDTATAFVSMVQTYAGVV